MTATTRFGWCGKALAGVILGFALAVALSGLFVWATPPATSKFQLAMWLVTPVWLAVLSASFLFRDGWRAWGWLGGATVAAHAALSLCREMAR